MEKVFCDIAGFPSVIKSDQAPEFVSEVMEKLNEMLNVSHITGSSYHPQSRAHVESMHKTLKHLMLGLVREYPDTWLDKIAFAVFSLRITPMKVLGGRSPYEVVTGLVPRLPRSLMLDGDVEEITPDTYAEGLLVHLRDTYRSLTRMQQEVFEKDELDIPGRNSSELVVGDLVLVKRDKRHMEESDGPRKFAPKTYPHPYRIRKKIGHNAFVLEDVTVPGAQVPFNNPQNATNLVRVDMPEVDVTASVGKHIEVFDNETSSWVPWLVMKVVVDGRVQLRSVRDVSVVKWVELEKHRYRWVTEHVAS